jgi:D-alanyl-D-alanine carboxypeptidase
MADSQRRRQATVGRRRNEGWTHLNAIAIGAVAVGVGALFVAVIGAIARDGGGGSGGLPGIGDPPPGSSQTVPAGQTSAPETPAVETPEPTEDSPEIVACGDPLAPMGKRYRLPSDCVPGDLVDLPADLSHGGRQQLRSEAASAFAELAAAAAQDGVFLKAVSAYRSYDAQVVAYEENRAIYGDEVDRFSARPGHSEHQLGTTADVSSSGVGYGLEPFDGTPEAAWIEANSWRYGFVVSYPEGMEHVTGYAYEPWHIRYVGEEVASEVEESGTTLHEYLLETR